MPRSWHRVGETDDIVVQLSEPKMEQLVDWTPFADRLRGEIDALMAAGDELLEASEIEYVGDRNRSGWVIFVAPDYQWQAPSDTLRRIQMATVPRFDAWYERYRFLFRDAPAELQREIDELHGQVREWLARDDGGSRGWDIPTTMPEAKATLRDRFSKLRSYLDLVAPSGAGGPTLAIPDTSALLDVADLQRYPAALAVTLLDVCLVPAVLSELDSLKDQGRNQDVRDKARAAGRMVKELRLRGSLLAGVDMGGGLRVFSRPQEPRFEDLPGRLDPSVPDDRILTSAFELQRDHPDRAVVLVTGDTNLQTKCELAGLPFVESPT